MPQQHAWLIFYGALCALSGASIPNAPVPEHNTDGKVPKVVFPGELVRLPALDVGENGITRRAINLEHVGWLRSTRMERNRDYSPRENGFVMAGSLKEGAYRVVVETEDSKGKKSQSRHSFRYLHRKLLSIHILRYLTDS